MNMLKSAYQSQQGVALLTILLLVVAITIVAGSMLARQKIMVREYEVIQRQGQFREALLAGEALACELLVQDSLANHTDSPQDSWAKPINHYPTDNGNISLNISDEASHFNINNLYHDGKVDELAVSYFKALLKSQGLEPNLTNAILDWQDPDSDTTPDGGAEADFYQSLGKAVAIANQPFLTVDDLLNVKGMDKEKLTKIKPLLTAVPYYVPMNVNTVNPTLLSVLPNVNPAETANQNQQNPASSVSPTSIATPTNATLDITALSSWANSRASAIPIDSIDKLWAVPVFATLSNAQRQRVAPLLDIQSRAFQIVVKVTKDDKQSFLISQLAKVDNQQSQQNNVNLTNQSQQVVAYHRQFLATPPVL